MTANENYCKVLNMKKRYLIDDIERELGITRRTYYNWENACKIPLPKRDPMSGYRYWTEGDLKRLKKITGRQ